MQAATARPAAARSHALRLPTGNELSFRRRLFCFLLFFFFSLRSALLVSALGLI
jgi:hypothetical protein